MAHFRTYHKSDGTVSVTATIRRKGYESVSETFTENTEAMAKQEAIDWATENERRIRQKKHKDPRSARITLETAFDQYFKMLELTRRKKPKTIQLEKWSRSPLEKILSKDIFISQIDTAVMAAYRDRRIEDGVGASKVRTELSLVSSLFQFLIQERSLPVENPVGRNKLWRPKRPKGKVDFLNEQEIKRFMAECRKSRNRKLAAYVTILINTGMRPGEASQVRVRDVDIKGRSIWLDETKNDDSRLVPLTDRAFKEIAKFILGRKPDEYIFHKSNKLPANYQKKPAEMFRSSFDAAKKRAKLPKITRHGMRHTAATHMLKNGVPLRVIASVLGHRTLQMAMRYTHPDETTLRQAVEKLGDLTSK